MQETFTCTCKSGMLKDVAILWQILLKPLIAHTPQHNNVGKDSTRKATVANDNNFFDLRIYVQASNIRR